MRFDAGRFFGRAWLALAVAAGLVSPAAAQAVQGSGSTFAQPIISTWARDFLRDRADGNDFVANEGGIDYEPVGSLAGILRLSQPEVDFAASDAPLPPEEVEKRGLAQFPIVLGGLAAVANLDGLRAGELRLDGVVLAEIYLGRITRWNDPAIARINPELQLPDQPISVVHRSDGSGSTLTWTRFLSASSQEWREKLGADTLIDWPTGIAAKGSSGVIEAIRNTRGAIGYVEFGQVVRAGLAYAQIRNRAGSFVTPSPESFAATASAADWDPAKDFYVHLTDVDAADAYPLAAATFVLMHRRERSAARTRRTLAFLSFALDKGAPTAAALGYVPLPDDLVAKVKDHWRAALPGAAEY
ncbi:phosphate ABC transporter substrate-binding protein PstS [Chelativorans sp.]|uniref:phosphate ABC transporter substrate-binding protein PstS n=1 Tax=Chelativorans sp. TaxID=2203393 RepID=UPI002811C738|nr:phosphate ABC transporter substrate-binding protein PstS [Chelativorans sp.]